MSIPKNKTFYTPQEAATRLMVSPITVRSWVTRGWLNAQTTAGGHRRFLVSDVEAFARSRGIAFARPGHDTTRVLIVDDDVQLTQYLNALLTEGPFNVSVEIAHDGFDAGFKIHRFNPDIVLLDLMMPGMDGFETCRRIKADPETAAIRVVAMTGYPSTENIQRIVNAGAERCFGKPLDEPAFLTWLGLEQAQQAIKQAPPRGAIPNLLGN